MQMPELHKYDHMPQIPLEPIPVVAARIPVEAIQVFVAPQEWAHGSSEHKLPKPKTSRSWRRLFGVSPRH